MTMFMVLCGVCLFALLVFIQSVRPLRSNLSVFELRRRQKMRDRRAEDAARREELLTQASVLKTPLTGLLLVLLTVLLLQLLGWTNGLLAALVVALFHERFAHLSPVRKITNGIFKRYEPALLGAAAKYGVIFRLLGGKRPLENKLLPLGSKEELARILEISPLFSDDEKRLMERALRFKERTAKELMTSKDEVVTVADTELLGPLVLDDLHKSGHTIFPVVKGDAVVGLLDSSDHFDLHTMESVHVRSVMHTDVAKVSITATLNDALRALLASKEQLLIVEGEDAQMAGVISLKDVMRAIVGK